AVITNVKRKAESRLLDPQITIDRVKLLESFISSLNEVEAREYAEYVLQYESLPFEERQKIKSVRSEEHRREYMQKLPPTERQLSYLNVLGCSDIPKDRAEASRLIDEYRNKMIRCSSGGKSENEHLR